MSKANRGSGFYEVMLDGRSLSTGPYFYRILVGGGTNETNCTNVKRMMLLKGVPSNVVPNLFGEESHRFLQGPNVVTL